MQYLSVFCPCAYSSLLAYFNISWLMGNSLVCITPYWETLLNTLSHRLIAAPNWPVKGLIVRFLGWMHYKISRFIRFKTIYCLWIFLLLGHNLSYASILATPVSSPGTSIPIYILLLANDFDLSQLPFQYSLLLKYRGCQVECDWGMERYQTPFFQSFLCVLTKSRLWHDLAAIEVQWYPLFLKL